MLRPQRNPIMPETTPQDAVEITLPAMDDDAYWTGAAKRRRERRLQVARDAVADSIDADGIVQVHYCHADEVFDVMDAFCEIAGNPSLNAVDGGGMLVEGTSDDSDGDPCSWAVLILPTETYPDDLDDDLTLSVSPAPPVEIAKSRDRYDRELVAAVALCTDSTAAHSVLLQDSEHRDRPTHPLYADTVYARVALWVDGQRERADLDTEWEPVGLIGSYDEICYTLYRAEWIPQFAIRRLTTIYRVVATSPWDASALRVGAIHESPGGCVADLEQWSVS